MWVVGCVWLGRNVDGGGGSWLGRGGWGVGLLRGVV